MVPRIKNSRRTVNPFGVQGPWLTVGKMGGLFFTDRRKISDRRTANRKEIQVVNKQNTPFF
jgi:hypothetical protein